MRNLITPPADHRSRPAPGHLVRLVVLSVVLFGGLMPVRAATLHVAPDGKDGAPLGIVTQAIEKSGKASQ